MWHLWTPTYDLIRSSQWIRPAAFLFSRWFLLLQEKTEPIIDFTKNSWSLKFKMTSQGDTSTWSGAPLPKSINLFWANFKGALRHAIEKPILLLGTQVVSKVRIIVLDRKESSNWKEVCLNSHLNFISLLYQLHAVSLLCHIFSLHTEYFLYPFTNMGTNLYYNLNIFCSSSYQDLIVFMWYLTNRCHFQARLAFVVSSESWV